MKTIGILGGMSRESTVLYYQIINTEVGKALGGLHSAQILLHSVDFQTIKNLQHDGKWDELTSIMITNARTLEKGGADYLVIATNTMHKMATDIQEAISISLIHIADATGETITKQGIKTIGLLGTKFTMEQDFYAGRLKDKYNLNVIVPDEEDRNTIHTIIYDELCKGIIKESSKQSYLTIMAKLMEQGAEGIILGCTEICMLVHQEDTTAPLFDTTIIHCQEIAKYAIQ